MKSFKIVLHLMFFFYSSIVFSQCDWQNVVIVDDINCLNGNWVICFEDNFDKNEINTIHGPIGIKLGGKSPPEIALSIIAQLILKTYNK